jgi:hypothetical protein
MEAVGNLIPVPCEMDAEGQARWSSSMAAHRATIGRRAA